MIKDFSSNIETRGDGPMFPVRGWTAFLYTAAEFCREQNHRTHKAVTAVHAQLAPPLLFQTHNISSILNRMAHTERTFSEAGSVQRRPTLLPKSWLPMGGPMIFICRALDSRGGNPNGDDGSWVRSGTGTSGSIPSPRGVERFRRDYEDGDIKSLVSGGPEFENMT